MRTALAAARLRRVGAVALALLTALGPIQAQVKVDPKLPEYKSVGGVSGNLKSIGSDTMNNEMTYWAESFQKFYPNVQIEIEGKGSTTAPPALIAGTAHFGPMSRPMKGKEIDRQQLFQGPGGGGRKQRPKTNNT